jgi:hypothetical protein
MKLNRAEIIKQIQSGELTEKEEKDILVLFEADVRQEAFGNYSVYAEEYIKIVDKDGNLVPFRHNKIQKKINDTVKEIRAAGRPVRIIVIKPRQPGVSTNEQGRMTFNCGTKENRTGLVVAHTQPATGKIFEKAKFMYENLPDHIKPLKKASNATELVFDRPTGYRGKGKGLNSKISIQTAGDVSMGRGDTIFYFHGSEVAFWPAPDGKGIKKQLAGIMASMPKNPETEAVLESTANGFNEFKELCDEALDGKNEWVLLFFAWHDHEPNQMPCTDEEYERLLNNLDDDDVRDYLFGADGQPGIIKAYSLTKEQVKWWVWTFQNDNNNDLPMMKQENPSNYNEAFIFSGIPIFNNNKVNARIEVLRKKYKKDTPKRGYFRFKWGNPDTEDTIIEKSIEWIDDPNGFITIYELPMSGYPYVEGGDTKGESINSDMYAGCVINNVTGNRAASLHGQWADSKPYTWQMYCLGYYYNFALIAIEMNWNTAPIEELERLHYPRQYQRKAYDKLTGEPKNAHGWKTDSNTRPLIIDKEVHLINKNTNLFNDITMLNECITFIRKDGKPDAMSGKHDDALFADMIASEIRRHQSFEAQLEREPEHRSFDEDNQRSGYDADESPFN